MTRSAGDLSGLNKDDARKKWGEEQVHIWRRSYDVPPPNGESLKVRFPLINLSPASKLRIAHRRAHVAVLVRLGLALPQHSSQMLHSEKEILPRVKKGETVLVAAHGNSLRCASFPERHRVKSPQR